MLMPATQRIFGARARALGAIGALLGALIALAATTAPPAVATKAKVIGKTASTPRPSCPAPKFPTPAQQCQAMGHVTGFQKSVDGQRGVFKVRQDGHLVAWRIGLSKPDEDERDFFGDNLDSPEFGSRPTARLSVIKKTDKKTYKLLKQSPVVEVNPFLGESPIFTLTQPLKVKKGSVVALTTPTWASNFAHAHLSKQNVWVGSRKPGRCDSKRDLLKRSKAHQEVGSERKYACAYTGARLLYWAYFVPE
jgi:hypothetical protein